MRVSCNYIKFEIGIIYIIYQGHGNIRQLFIDHGERNSDVIWKNDKTISEKKGNALNQLY